MTIQVGQELPNGRFETTCMPVIRFPNFSLRDFLDDPKSFLSGPDSWKTKEGKARTLLAKRASKVLVSAKA